MRSIVAAVVACLAIPVSAVTVDMSPDERASCEAEGGCVFATQDHIKALLKQAYEAGLNRGRGLSQRGLSVLRHPE
jgi:hypothetical protein